MTLFVAQKARGVVNVDVLQANGASCRAQEGFSAAP
jgi:hypothetical protein